MEQNLINKVKEVYNEFKTTEKEKFKEQLDKAILLMKEWNSMKKEKDQ
jgi:hypothetical protein